MTRFGFDACHSLPFKQRLRKRVLEFAADMCEALGLPSFTWSIKLCLAF